MPNIPEITAMIVAATGLVAAIVAGTLQIIAAINKNTQATVVHEARAEARHEEAMGRK